MYIHTHTHIYMYIHGLNFTEGKLIRELRNAKPTNYIYEYILDLKKKIFLWGALESLQETKQHALTGELGLGYFKLLR